MSIFIALTVSTIISNVSIVRHPGNTKKSIDGYTPGKPGMKKNFFLFAFLFLISAQIRAQNNLPPVYEIKSDTAKWQTPDISFWQQLEDSEGNWTISNVSKPPLSGKFHTPDLKTADTGLHGIHTCWLRYRLKNTMNQDAKISLLAQVDYFSVFVIENDLLQAQYHTGLLQPWDKKDGLKAANYAGAIPLVLKPAEEILVYDRRQRAETANFKASLKIYSTEKLIQEQYIDYVENRKNYFAKINLQEAFVLGLLLLAIFLNGLFYRIVKEKVYLYFALFALFLGINRLWNISNIYFRWEHPALLTYVPLLGYAWAFIPLFLIQFFRQFLKIKMAYPRWDKLLLWAGILNLLMVSFIYLSHFFSRQLSSFFSNAFSLLAFFFIPLCIVITLLLFAGQKEKPVRYVIIGSFPFLLLYLLTSPEQVFGIQIKFIDALMENFRLIEVICISWLVLSFSLILMMRFDRLRKENAQQALENEVLAREKEAERNELIEKQKAELEIQVAERTADLQQSIADLKSAQSQLIHAEKMASLGELTAGIAHEIQNPLNFVNNFSELSNELIEELKSERLKVEGKKDTELEDELLKDIAQNLERINHHGKRADAIVKGMLQHSRSSGGAKEPTDINKLADEYLRLAYHGLRAKDKSFNAELKTDFDEMIGNVNIIPQDIGRVILNLVTNAFYAVNEKKHAAATGDYRSFENFGNLETPQVKNYEPTVSVSTKKTRDKVEIKVTDNGNGIPQKILEKIFHPFFTTKPTGQGTGLGLSLAYDIVKAHGAELKVKTKEGEGTEFIIELPVT